jgi:hypothetical protein
MCLCYNCFRSNWLCIIFTPIVLGPIKCVYASIISTRVQLIALAKIECTWFVQIWVCCAITCLIFVTLMKSCWVAKYFYVIMLSEIQCATSIFVWAWMHVCLKVFAFLCVCLRKSKNALCIYSQILMLVLHKLELNELDGSYGMKYQETQICGSFRWQYFTSVTLSLVVNS